MEFWDIYDSEKRVTGRKMLRNDWHMKPGDYHLTVLALIRDAAGRILITHVIAAVGYRELNNRFGGLGI